ncbi:MAG: helix-turn-helix domain-containing protein [Gammaproteobacteria bacterium]|nr:helix-turn-helix domain-containing protein [Gammaproteobacteria bacterium]
MNFSSMTDNAIAAEIGGRIEQMRLEQNLTQQQIADEVGLSRLSYRKLVNGSGKFQNVIAVLRVLGRLDLVQNFVPETTFSPIEQLKLKGKQRRRASATRSKKTKNAATSEIDSELDW